MRPLAASATSGTRSRITPSISSRRRRFTSSARLIADAAERLYRQTVDPALLIRRVTITADHLTEEDRSEEPASCEQLELFTDYEAIEREKAEENAMLEKERRLQEAVLRMKKKYGKNAGLKGMNLQEGAMTRERNNQIGGHKA